MLTNGMATNFTRKLKKALVLYFSHSLACGTWLSQKSGVAIRRLKIAQSPKILSPMYCSISKRVNTVQIPINPRSVKSPQNIADIKNTLAIE